MNMFIVMLAKMAKFILKFVGRGTAFPGDLALKLNKNIISYFQMPKTTIFITGTTGNIIFIMS